MRIAIASSGLGHVARGIETWALDTAAALAARGVDVTLFGGERVVCRVSKGAQEPPMVALPGLNDGIAELDVALGTERHLRTGTVLLLAAA